MINILIVDDDSNKIRDLCSIINEFSEVPRENIEYELEVKKAYHKLQLNQYDLVILDIKLPNQLGNSTIDDGGISLLETITNTDRIKKPSYIIGLTSYEDKSYEKYESVFNEHIWALLKYDKASNDWKEKIRRKIRYIIQWRKNIFSEIKYCDKYDYDYAIITAVEREYKSVLELDLPWKIKDIPNDGTQYHEAIIKGEKKELKFVLAKQHQMGMAAAATLSMKMINSFKPMYLCMLGIAAGKKGKVNLGDIIVAAESWDYGSGKIREKSEEGCYLFEPEPHQIAIDTHLKELFEHDYTEILYDIRKNWNSGGGKEILNDLRVHVGALASGAAVIQDESVVTEFIDPHNRKLLGLDMETYAVYFAASNALLQKPRFFSIKAVCDFADKNKQDDYQKYAAYASAQFFYQLVKKGL